MSAIQELHTRVVRDRRITPDEVAIIQAQVRADGRLDMQDVKLLVELLSDSIEVCPEFDDLFFPVLKNVLLADGKILADEQFYLLKMLYSDGRVRDNERDFLRELRDEIEPTPEFAQLCTTAFQCPDENWSVGGS